MRSIYLIVLFSLRLSSQVAPPSWSTAIEALIASGNLAEARERLQHETRERGETSAGLYLEARILFEEKRYSEALQEVRRSLVLAPDDAELYKLAALTAIRMDRTDIAEPALKTAARLAPNDYLVHFHLGALYYTNSMFYLAKPELQQSAGLNPRYMPALLFLGLTLEEVGEEKITIETYRKAIEVAATQRTAAELPYVYLGKFLYRLNRFDDSFSLLQKAAEINPHSGEALLALGKTLRALKRDNEAAAVIERSAVADAQNPEPHYLLFRIFESEGRAEAAGEELKRFQALKPKQTDDNRRRVSQSMP
jgi:tetratricopeptide (TPR) repeat protein